MKAMILAAGYGRRLRPLTDHTPKPLLHVQGKPLIQYHLERLAASDIKDIVINHSWLGEQLEGALGDGAGFGVSISWSREQLPLETGGGVKQALPLLVGENSGGSGGEVFMLISGDVWTDFPFNILSDLNLNGKLAHLVLVPNPSHHPDGDFQLDSYGAVTLKQGQGESLTYSGIALISPDLFVGSDKLANDFPLREVLRPAIEARKVSGEIYRGVWSDVGTVDRLKALNA
jgi:N-acetyl-alpha-D-muramate 1-phosphate uridylyltransferase